MKLSPFFMESWLSEHRFQVQYNLAESGMRDLTLNELLAFCGKDPSALGELLMEDMPTLGSGYLREAIAETYEGVKPNEILVATGTGEALFIFFNTVLEAGDEVVTSFPAFQALYEIPRAIGCKLKFYEHRIEEGYRFDQQRFLDLITSRTKLIIVNTPHNPTGAVAAKKTMRAISEKASEAGALVLFDEHYRFLPHDNRALLASGVTLGAHCFATGSITKCFGAMGLRVGWLVGEEAMLLKCSGFRDYLSHTLSPISEKLTALALTHKNELLAESKRILIENKKALTEWMDAHREAFDFVAPKAGVVSFPRYKHPINSSTLAKRLIDEAGVFCLPGDSFEMDGYLRIGLGRPPAQFQEALATMDRSFEQP